MSRELLFRMAVAWPPDGDRRALIDARLDTHLALWTERLSRWFAPGRPEAVWLSDQVLQVRAAAVTLWAVLTDGEVSVFWEAPPAVRLLVGAHRREAMISAFRAELGAATSARSAEVDTGSAQESASRQGLGAAPDCGAHGRR